jgi:O-antigen ligase
VPNGARLGIAAVLVAAPTVLAFFSGGYFGVSHGQVGVLVSALAWLLVALVLVLEPAPLPPSRAGRVALAGLAALTAWTALSLLWSPLRDPGLADVERTALYCAAFVAGVAVLRGTWIARTIEPALLFGISVVCGYALATRLLPGIVESTGGFRAGSRLDQPLTYWNALGALSAMGLLLAIHTAADARRAARLRLAGAALIPPLGLVLFLTVSRGAHLAAAVGVVVLLLMARDRRAVAASVLGVALVALTAGIAARFPGVVELQGSNSTREHEALAVLALTLVLSGASVAIQTALLRLERRGEAWTSALRTRPALGAPAGAAALVCIALGVSAFAGGEVGASPDQKGPERFRTIETNRWHYWEVAVDSFAEQPLTGSGVHGFAADWLERRDIDEAVQDGHSLYIETLTELGLPGFVFLLTFLGGAALALVRAGEPGWAAAAAVWAIHAGVDWDWEMPALTLVFIVLAAAASATAASTQRAGSAANRSRVMP